MLNENKVKMMTKMAIYEKNEGRKMIRMARYFKGDYIALGVLKSFIATTFAYIILVVLYVFCNLETLVARISSMDFAQMGKTMLLCYVALMAVNAIIAALVSSYQYNVSRKGLKRYFSRLNKLEHYYNGQRKKR